MESQIAARFAADHKAPFAILRVVSGSRRPRSAAACNEGLCGPMEALILARSASALVAFARSDAGADRGGPRQRYRLRSATPLSPPFRPFLGLGLAHL